MRNRPLALFLAFVALALLGLALAPGNDLATGAAIAAGLFGAVAYVQWRGPRER